jgi:GNAT superfamily N-acetyltransferase
VVSEAEIVLLADRPELIPVVGRWHWDQWGDEDPDGSAESWIEGLRRRSGRDRIPISWAAVLGGEPVGSVALIAGDMTSRPELGPWVSGLYVVPECRRRGIGGLLNDHCEAAAAALGVPTLYLHTIVEAFYERRGWRVLSHEPYGRERVALMTKDLASDR